MLLTGLLVTVGLFTLTVVLYVVYMSRNHGEFKKYGIEGKTCWPLFGNFYQELKTGFSKYHKARYNECRAKGLKAYAHYRVAESSIIITNLDLARDIYVKHFSSFTNRNNRDLEEPHASALTQLKDADWKRVRATISPTFSTARLRVMMRHIEANVRNLLAYLTEKDEKNEPLEMKDVCSKLTMDVIAATSFGIQVNSFDDPDNDFQKEIQKMFKSNGKALGLLFFFNFLMPVLRKLGVTIMNKDTTAFLKGAVDSAIEHRKEEGTKGKRNDFLQLMLDAEKFTHEEDDNMTAEEAEATGAATVNRGISHTELQGQSMQFVLAGYETVSTGMSFCLFMMSLNPECLTKVVAEIDEVLEGKPPTYETLGKLHYLEMCIFETLRYFPIAPLVERLCSEDITLGGVTFPKGCTAGIPITAFHHDPEIWPEPDKFDPERFTEENKAKRHPYAYQPFGLGPRMCIGMRLGMIEMKMGLTAVLQRFTPVRCEKTVWPVEMVLFQVRAKHGLWLRLEARK